MVGVDASSAQSLISKSNQECSVLATKSYNQPSPLIRFSYACPRNHALRRACDHHILRMVGLGCSRPASQKDAPSKRCSTPRKGKERHVSDQAATLSSPIPVPAKPAPAPAAARTKKILEGPVFTTLMKLSAPNVLNLLAFTGMVTFDGFFLGKLGSDALAGASLVFP